jgi:hypothetical protein
MTTYKHGASKHEGRKPASKRLPVFFAKERSFKVMVSPFFAERGRFFPQILERERQSLS